MNEHAINDLDIAPTGHLRVTINLGNAVLARKGEGGRPEGVSVDIAAELGARLVLPVEFVTVDAAAKAVEAIRSGRADVGFFAVDPARSEGIAFTAPYILIEGCYLVKDDSPFHSLADIDKAGTRVVVGGGSAYDLFLTRELRAAELVRVTTSQAVVGTFLDKGMDAAAGVRQQLDADLKRHSGLRMLPEPFMVIKQAMGIGRARGEAAHRHLAAFVEDIKASGFVADALRRHGQSGVTVAPPAQ